MAVALSERVVLRLDTPGGVEVDGGPWHDRASLEDEDVLASVVGPVIDLGCGPGRLLVSLAARGIPSLGIDSSPTAVSLARSQGATVLRQDLFQPLPAEGQWATALLFDGNVGIGGDPVRLLARCRALIADHGQVVAEVQPPGQGWSRCTAWFERGGHRGDPFSWAVVGADAIADLARAAGLRLAEFLQTASGRWFARLVPVP